MKRHLSRRQCRLGLSERRRDEGGQPRLQIGQQREPFGRSGQQGHLVGSARVPRGDRGGPPGSRRPRWDSGPSPANGLRGGRPAIGGSSVRTLTAKSNMPGAAA